MKTNFSARKPYHGMRAHQAGFLDHPSTVKRRNFEVFNFLQFFLKKRSGGFEGVQKPPENRAPFCPWIFSGFHSPPSISAGPWLTYHHDINRHFCTLTRLLSPFADSASEILLSFRRERNGEAAPGSHMVNILTFHAIFTLLRK
nr:hypothetical protein [uncultured Shinella sp.]